MDFQEIFLWSQGFPGGLEYGLWRMAVLTGGGGWQFSLGVEDGSSHLGCDSSLPRAH